MSTPADPLINVRAKTQLVSEGVTRYMGEQWQMPLREGLGLVGAGETEQWIDPLRPLTWAQNAPGPHESWQQLGDPQTQGSREGAIGGGPAGVRGGSPGDQQMRQIAGQNTATFLQPQQYDDYRTAATAGRSGPTDQWWQKGATGATGGAVAGPISPQRPGAQTGQIPGQPSSRRPHQPPQRGPQGQVRQPPGMFPPRRPPGFTPPRPPGREERRDDRDDRREARHERRDERYDQRHEERHERREDRYDRRHEARDDRGEARHERRDERGDREAHHERRDERGGRDQEGRRHHKG